MNKILASLNGLQSSLATLGMAQWVARLPVAVNVLMILLLASTMANVTWKVMPLPGTPEAPAREIASVSDAPGTAPKATSYAAIANWHLFGDAKKAPPKVVKREPTPQVAPETTLRLTLMGVFASSDMQDAFAIIADASRQEETYRVDDAVPGGAILKEIYADRIILLRNNRYETLRLPKEGLPDTGSSRSTASRSSRSSVSSPRNQVARLPSSGTGVTTTVTGEAAAVLRDYREKLINDPQSVMNAVRAEPYRKNGQLAGYRVFPGADRGLMDKVGLQPGDVVTSVNGIELDSPLKGLEIMKNLSDASEVSVNVVRNGATQTFVIPVQ